MHTPPTVNAAKPAPIIGINALNELVMGTVAPRTKLGTVLVTVLLRFVPNCSDATVTKSAQKPVDAPNMKHMK